MRLLAACRTAILVISSTVIAATAGVSAEPKIKLKADLGHAVMKAGEGGRVYLRVGIEGLTRQEESSRAPVNVALVIDKSGSMEGARIAQAKEAAVMALERLSPQDFLAVVAYDHNVRVIVPAAPARDLGPLREAILSIQAGGRTALYAGVRQGMKELEEFLDPYQVNRLILLSDGLANVGPSTPAELAELGREAAADGISITTIGLGLGYNEDLMTQLALASDGNHAFVEHPDDLVDIFNKEFGDVLSVIAQNAQVQITFPEGIRPLRTLGRQGKIDGQTVRLDLGQVYSRQEKYVIVEIEVDGAVAKGDLKAAIVQAGYLDTDTKERQTVRGDVHLRFSADAKDVEASRNTDVLSAAAIQIATERSEAAVKLRDAGKIEEAKKLLEDNAAYLKKQAEALASPASPELETMAENNLKDAQALSGSAWNKTRKLMRARQYKEKTQQSY